MKMSTTIQNSGIVIIYFCSKKTDWKLCNGIGRQVIILKTENQVSCYEVYCVIRIMLCCIISGMLCNSTLTLYMFFFV